jgi:hypothetical protein
LRKTAINRERVLGLIKTASVALTTAEMGRILKVKERSVRAAVTWLILGGFIIPQGTIISRTTSGKYGKRKFKIQIYKWTGKEDDICKIHTDELVDVGVTNLRTGKSIQCIKVNSAPANANFLQSLMKGMRRG